MRLIKFATSAALSCGAVENAIDEYKEHFDDSPWLLIVGEGEYFTAKEVLHGGDRLRLEVVGWLPPRMWMLTGAARHGLFVSGEF